MCCNQVEVECEHFIILKDPADTRLSHTQIQIDEYDNDSVCTHSVFSVTAEVRGSELHMAQQSNSINSVATLSSILLSDGVHACVIWKTIAFV